VSKQIPLPLRISETKRFDNYVEYTTPTVVGALKSIVEHEDDKAHGGVMFLWGGEATGKTHLLNAACHYGHAAGKSVIYLPMAEIKNERVSVLEQLETFDVVCLDDIQEIAGNRSWEEGVFHLFNQLRARKGRMIASANKNISLIHFSLLDFATRLAWGLVWHLVEADDETKQKILVTRAQERGLSMAEDVAEYMIRHCSRGLNDLLDTLDKIDTASLAEHKKITVPFVKRLLA